MRHWLGGWCMAMGLAMAMPVAAQAPPVAEEIHLALSDPAVAPEPITFTVYLPPDYAAEANRQVRYAVLYANDGQDMAAVGLRETLASLYAQHAMAPVIVVAVDMLKDRASGYGLSDRQARRSVVGDSRIGPIGLRAYDYSQWLATVLVPYVDAHYRTQANVQGRTVLGWSLGGLNAFNLGWEYPDVFGQVGAFSPSFWLAADRSDANAVENTRLAHAMLQQGKPRHGLRMWFAVGDHEETSDRNGNGVIDAVEDVQDVLLGFHAPDGSQRPGLRQLGYGVEPQGARHPQTHADVVFYELAGGEHNQASWKRMLPPFLAWAFPPQGAPSR